MCGFVGVLQPKGAGPVRAETLARLLPHIRHRGPDQEGVRVEGSFGVAAARLAIRGGPEGDQPLRRGGSIVAFNGELLCVPAPVRDIAHSENDTVEFLSDSSVAAVAHLLNGNMGAVAIYDEDALQLHADPLGIKSIHTARSQTGALWFSSEILPLLHAVPEARRLDPRGMAELLRWQRPRLHTPFKGIEGPTIRNVGLIVSPHEAGLDETQVVGETLPFERSDQDPVAPLRQAWRTSAVAAAHADEPVCLFLSGGLDSSAVAAFADRPDLIALTGRFEGAAFDESASAAAVANYTGIRHEIVDLRDEDLLLDLPDVIRALEIPMAGPGSLALWRMAMRAREHARIVLTGTGGDELFGGYARTAIMLGRAGIWTRGYESLRSKIESAGPRFEARLNMAFDRSPDLEPLLTRDFLHSLPGPAPVEFSGSSQLESSRSSQLDVSRSSQLDAALEEERAGTLRSLLHVEDRVTMAHGIEGRPVACLGGLPALARQIPEAWLVGPDGEGKRALRAALKGHIPEHVRTDPCKRGFPTPFARAARGAGRDIAMQVLHDRRFVERGWWNVEACRALMDQERPDYDRALWALLSWETWARLFLDGDAFEPSEENPDA